MTNNTEIVVPVTFNKAAKTTARNVVQLRKQAKMTQLEFSEATGLSVATIHRIEAKYYTKASYNPSSRTLIKLATATGTTVDEFISNSLTYDRVSSQV